jgi:hypothetical protein
MPIRCIPYNDRKRRRARRPHNEKPIVLVIVYMQKAQRLLSHMTIANPKANGLVSKAKTPRLRHGL